MSLVAAESSLGFNLFDPSGGFANGVRVSAAFDRSDFGWIPVS